MKELSDSGYTTLEITNYLNSKNIKSPKGLDYYPKLVWVTLNKYRKRLNRYQNDMTLSQSESLVVEFRSKRDISS